VGALNGVIQVSLQRIGGPLQLRFLYDYDRRQPLQHHPRAAEEFSGLTVALRRIAIPDLDRVLSMSLLLIWSRFQTIRYNA